MKLLVVIGAVIAAVSAGGVGASTSSSLELRGVLQGRFDNVACPAGTAPTTSCYRNELNGPVPGLGAVSILHTLLVENADTDGATWRAGSAITDARGEIQIAAKSSACLPYGPSGAMDFTVTRGSGAYTGASGSGRLETRGTASGVGSGTTRSTITGTLVAPGHEFDLTAPALAGARSKTVKAPRRAKWARVKFAVTAQDGVDGPTAVHCEPRSGSRFKLGRTRVSCSATDASANTGTARFWVTVKRRT